MKNSFLNLAFNVAYDGAKAGFDIMRGVGEIVVSPVASRIAGQATLTGDGKNVVLLPGFSANEFSLKFMKGFLEYKNYNAYHWGLGGNVFIDEKRMDKLERRLEKIFQETGRKSTLVGQSLGGVVALYMAAKRPDLVEGIMTLGSPLTNNENPEDVSFLTSAAFNGLNTYVEDNQDFIDEMSAFVSPLKDVLQDPEKLKNIKIAALYSKGDGIVGSKVSTLPLDGSDNPLHQNIELGQLTESIGISSHCGMGFNVQVLTIIADLLSKRDGQSPKFKSKDYPMIFPRHMKPKSIKHVFG